MLFVSYSGATRDMMETLRTAKDAGAKNHFTDPLRGLPRRGIGGCSAAVRGAGEPADSGSIPIKGGGALRRRGAAAALHDGRPRDRQHGTGPHQ